MHNPFHDGFVQTPRRLQLGSFSIHPAEQILPLRIDEGDRGQIHTHRIDPLSAGSGPPTEFQLLHPRAGELPLKLEGHHTGFYFHVNFQHKKFFKPLSLFSKPRSSRRQRFVSFRSSAKNSTAVAIAASHSTFRESEPCPDSIQRLLVRYMEHD